jgi:ankyrin repeat protein
MEGINFLCPIGHDLLLDPMIAEDGYFYNRKHITVYFGDKQTVKSPITGMMIGTRLTAAKQFQIIVRDIIMSSNTLDQYLGCLTISDIIEYNLETVPKILLSVGSTSGSTSGSVTQIFIDFLNDGNSVMTLKVLDKFDVDYNHIIQNESQNGSENRISQSGSQSNDGNRISQSGLQSNDGNQIVYGVTPLIIACCMRMTDVAVKLLEKPDINYQQVADNNRTALLYACKNKMTEVALRLLEKPDINYNHVTEGGYTPLLWACRNQMTDVAVVLLKKPDINYLQVSKKGYTPLLLACVNQMTDVAVVLLEKPDINYLQVADNGTTALIQACVHKMSTVAIHLLGFPNIVDDGRALTWALQNHMTDTALLLVGTPNCNYLRVTNAGISSLMWACKNKMSQVAMRLLEKPDINYNWISPAPHATTALMLACSSASKMTEVALRLLALPNINYTYIFNSTTALTLAHDNGMHDVTATIMRMSHEHRVVAEQYVGAVEIVEMIETVEIVEMIETVEMVETAKILEALEPLETTETAEIRNY